MKFDVTGLSYQEILSALNSFDGSELKITKLGKNVIAEVERVAMKTTNTIQGVDSICF